MAVVVTLDLRYKPEAAAEGIAKLQASLTDTRAFEGNRGVRMLVGADDPTRVLLVEDWESREAQQAYVAWRAEGRSSLTPDRLEAPPTVSFFEDRFSA
jgi:quinol monooxygenase YgiN